MENNGKKWTTMDNNGQQWKKWTTIRCATCISDAVFIFRFPMNVFLSKLLYSDASSRQRPLCAVYIQQCTFMHISKTVYWRNFHPCIQVIHMNKSCLKFLENTNRKHGNLLKYLWKYKYEIWKYVRIFVEIQIWNMEICSNICGNANMKHGNMLKYLWKYKYETWKAVKIFVKKKQIWNMEIF